MLNKNGPSIEPCGTPAIIFSQELKLLLTRGWVEYYPKIMGLSK